MIRASSILFWFGLTIAASLALYHTSDRVHELDHQLASLNASIDAEQRNMHVLKAEWVYLANPARVEATAKKHLALRPTVPQQVVALRDIDDALPTRTQAMGQVAVTGMPMANIRTSLAVPSPGALSGTRKIHLAAIDTSHINNHMKIERTASAESLTNRTDALIADLGTHP